MSRLMNSEAPSGLAHRVVYIPSEARDHPCHYSYTLDVYSFGIIATQIIEVRTNLKNKEEVLSILDAVSDNYKLKEVILKCLNEMAICALQPLTWLI